MRIPCEIRSDDNGGVVATCTECGHVTRCKGESEKSINRSLALMREQCPEGKENFYVEDD
jgi:RNase P subunit RPR2